MKKKAIDFLTTKPGFFLGAALLWLGVMCLLNSMDVGPNGFSWHDLLVEANGMFFDLLVFGIFLSIYEASKEKKEKIERLNEEIDDYRGWDEKEATYRIVGAIRRLKREGVNQIDLKKCYLVNAYLPKAILSNSDLSGANLAGADLSGAYLTDANLIGANLVGANLSGANLTRARMKGAKLCKANFSNADLTEADLTNALLSEYVTYETDPDPYDSNDYYDDVEIEYIDFFRKNSESGAANLLKAKLLRTKLLGANLNCVDFFNADLSESDLSNAELINARLAEANLKGANLTRADLTGAYLNDAIVKTNWMDKIVANQVKGSNEIIQQYSGEESDGYIVLKKQ